MFESSHRAPHETGRLTLTDIKCGHPRRHGQSLVRVSPWLRRNRTLDDWPALGYEPSADWVRDGQRDGATAAGRGGATQASARASGPSDERSPLPEKISITGEDSDRPNLHHREPATAHISGGDQGVSVSKGSIEVANSVS